MKTTELQQRVKERLIEYVENIPLQISILSQLIEIVSSDPIKAQIPPEFTSENVIKILQEELDKVRLHKDVLSDVDAFMVKIPSENLQLFFNRSSSEESSENLILSLVKIHQVKADWPATLEWTKIKAGNLIMENTNLIAGTTIAAATGFLAGSLANFMRQNQADLPVQDVPLDQQYSGSMTVTVTQNLLPTLALGALQKLLSSVTEGMMITNVSEVLNNFFIGSVADNLYQTSKVLDALIALAALKSNPTSLASYLPLMGLQLIMSANPALGAGTQKIMYCGLKVDCDHLLQISKKSGFVLQQFEKERSVQDIKSEVETLILHAHAGGRGYMEFTDTKQEQPDNFMIKYFPQSKIIHVVGCSMGEAVERNFGINSLKAGQLMFIHAGENNIVDMGTIAQLMMSSTQPSFPSPIPTQIIFKKDHSESSIFKIIPPVYSKIEEIISDLNSKNKIELLFNLINQHFLQQKSQILEKLKDHKDAQLQVESELEKIGFVDYSGLDEKVKTKLVSDYLSANLVAVEITSEQKIALIKSDLIDVNYQTQRGISPLLLAAQYNDLPVAMALINHPQINPNQENFNGLVPLITAADYGNNEIVTELLKHKKIAVDHANKDSATALFMAAQNGFLSIVQELLKHLDKIDLNHAANHGETALFRASQNNHPQIVKTLIEHGDKIDPNKARDHDGTTPLFVAVQLNNLAVIEELLKHPDLDLNKAVKSGATPLLLAISLKQYSTVIKLINHGADPDLMAQLTSGNKNAYNILNSFYANDPNLPKDFVRQMQDARKEFLEKSQECVKSKNPTSPVGQSLNAKEINGQCPLIAA